MNNSLFTQTFTRLKPTKYLTNLARLKNLLKHLKHLKSLSALILATLLVACAAGGGGGGSSTAGPSVSAFSHNGYTFASGLADSDSVPGVGDPNYSPTPVGQVYANDNRIKSLAATLIGITDPQQIAALAEGTDYRVTFSLVADATRPNVALYFSVDETSGIITVTNPYGEDSDLTFGDIRGFLNDNSINVKLTVTVTNPKDAEIPNTDRSVTVKILDSSAAPQLDANGADAELVYAITSISSAGRSETDQPDTQSVDLTGELAGTRIESGTAVADFAFSSLVRGLSANDFTATTATPTGGVLASPRNAFAATDIYNATHITQDLTVNVNISLNSNGSMYVAAPVSFSADTEFSLVDGDVSTTSSFLNQVNTLVAASPGSPKFLSSTATDAVFNLNLTSWDVSYEFTRSFTPAAITTFIPGRPTFAVAGDLEENNPLASRLTFGTPQNPAVKSSNPITSFSIQRATKANSESAQVTIFYGLRSLDNSALCGNGAIYLDNNDLSIKAGAIFDFEGLAQKTYQCRLAVSATGNPASYLPLALVLNGGTAAGAAAPIGTNIVDLSDSNLAQLAQVAQSGTDKQLACSATNPCYYADVNITITDGNDAPVVSLASATEFAGSNEGKGVLPAYNNATKYGFQTFGTNGELNTATNSDSVQISIMDEDVTQTSTDKQNVKIAVSPLHGSAAFSINQSTDPEIYELLVNGALLDYEAFTPAQLTADDKAIYKITLTAADNATATLSSSETFDFEVRDVQFTPVFVNSRNRQRPALEPAAAFIKESNILAGPNGSPIYLLSDIRALNRIGIGSIAAVDPETGSGAGIVYRFMPSPNPATPVRNNIALTPSTDGLSSRLEIAGVGLTDGNADSVVFQASKATDFSTGVSNTGPVDLLVNNTAYADAAVLIPVVTDPVNITFNRAIPLLITLPEVAASDAVADLDFSVTLPGGGEISFTDLTTPIVGANIPLTFSKDTSATPFFGFVDSALFSAIARAPLAAEIAALGFDLAADLSAFSINNATGQISVNTSDGLTFPEVFTLPIYVTDATAFDVNTADITIVTVVITDVNAEPQAMSITGTPLDTTIEGQLSGTIAENLPAGTPIATTTFTLTDDNLPFGGVPTFSFTGAAADLFNLTTIANDVTVGGRTIVGSITATLITKQSFDYEDATLRNNLLSGLTLVITDAGRYTLFGAEASVDPATARFLRAPLPTLVSDSETTQVAVSINLTDAAEAPNLTVVAGTHSIKEDATNATDSVTSATGDNVIAMLNNPTDFPGTEGSAFNSSRVTLAVTGDFAGILEARYINAAANTDAGAISLTVVDAERLENLGDGLTFTATIVATVAGLDPVAKSTEVRIVNVRANSRIDQGVIDALIQDAITINEQDVAGQSGAYSVPAAKFNIAQTSLVKDADEFIGSGANRRPVVSPKLSIGEVTLAGNSNLNPELTQTDILTLTLENGNYRLSINDADFVESALFGDLGFTLNVSTRSTPAGVLADEGDDITITPATPKRVVYANAARDAAATPPVYALSYTQTRYAEPVTNFSGVDATTTTIINASTDFIFGEAVISGVATEYINISADNVYPTLVLVDAAGQTLNGNFIARDYTSPATLNPINSINTAVENGVNITINFADETLSLLDEDGQHQFDILKPDATGNLEDASAEFNAYFNLAVNNTATNKHIQITQKLFSQVDDVNNTYHALDTIQLYQDQDNEGGEAHTLNYFIRARSATDGTTNASNYALAQFSVALEAAGLNEPTQILRAALVPASETLSGSSADEIISASTLKFNSDNLLTLDENQVAVNDFTQYKLLVEFDNPDGDANKEAASAITVTIPRGSITGNTREGNAASDGELIALRLSPLPPNSAAPTANAPTITDTSGAFPQSDFAGAPGRYIREYDFALARNLAGTATIEITVADRESGAGTEEISSTTKTFSIEVTPQTVAPAPTLTATIATDVNIATATLNEDTAPLPTAAATERNLDLSITTTSNNAGVLGRTEQVVLTSIGTSSTPTNPRSKRFLTRIDGGTVAYTAHGWGVHRFNYLVSYVEPRGFGSDTISYSMPVSQDVGVNSQPDATTLASSNGFRGFVRADFDGSGSIKVDRTGVSVTFADPDLDFDNDIAMVLGATATLTPDNAELVFTNSGSYTVTQDPDNDAQALVEGISYSLSLSEQQAADKADIQYGISFGFDGAGTNITGGVRVGFSTSAEDPVIVAGSPAFPTDSTSGTANIAEESIQGATVATLTIEDGDIKAADPGTYTYSFAPGGNAGGLVEWASGTLSNTDSSDRRANQLVLARKADDADVGVTHTIEWTMQDTKANNNELSGTLTFSITRIEDTATGGAISFTDSAGERNINTNTDLSKLFPIALTFADDDFLEATPTINLQGSTYDSVTFTIDQPLSSDLSCVVAANNSPLVLTQGSATQYGRPGTATATRSGNLASGGVASSLNFGDIKAATGCNAPEIGSTITAASFAGVTVESGESSDLGTISATLPTSPVYTIQGYRTESHSIEVPGSVSVPGGGSETITVTITDGDPDDGIPSDPTLNNDPNVVRSNDGTAAAWPALSVEVTGGADCISKISPAVGSYTAGSSSSQSIAVITIGATGDAPVNSCTLTIRATGEDGQLVAPVDVGVTVQPAPSFVSGPAFTPATLTDAFDYDNPGVTISGMVITNDDDSVFPTVTLTSLDTRCSLTQTSFTNPSNISPYSFTSSVIPSDTGTCRIKVITMEDGVITEDTVSITFPELTPTVVASPAVVNPAISGLITLQGRSVSIVVNATKRDPGTSMVEFPRSINSAAPACTANIGNGGGGNLVVGYTGNQIGATASVTYTVTSAAAINCGAFTFTATENSKIGIDALPGVSFVSPESVAPTVTLNTGASLLNVRADALGSINLSIARNSHLLSDAIANPTLVVTASVPANATATCMVTPTTTNIGYSDNPQTATTGFSVDWTGDEVTGGLCPVTVSLQEQDRIPVALPLATTTINFGGTPQQVGLEINNPLTGGFTIPASAPVTVTVTATKRDILTGPNTGVIFRKPVLVGNSLPNYCVVISPTSDTPIAFTPNVLGDTETLNYVFGVNPALLGRESSSCKWRISATSQGVSDAEVGDNIAIPFTIINQLPLLSVGEVATNVYPDDGAVPINLTLTKRDDSFNPRVFTAVSSIAGPCSAILVQQAVYPSTGFNAIGVATHNITFTGDKTSGGTCVLNEFNATEDDLTTTVNEERSIRFLPEVLPSIAFNIDGNSFAPSSSFVVLDVTLTKQDASNNKELTIPSIVRSSACTAILIGDAPAGFTGGIGSNVRLSYNVTSTSGSSTSCGNFPFSFAEGTTAVMQGYSGISFTSPLGNSEPAIQVAVLGDRVVADFANVTINITATNRDQQGERVTFPQTVMSTSPVCVATLAAGLNATVDYSGSITNLTASVQYIVMPNIEINCGDFTFTATEDSLIGSPFSPLSGISFLDSTKPPTVVAVVNNRRVLPGEMVEIIVTATKVDDYGDQQVRFPQVVNSSAPVCTATLTSASTATQNYASNQAGTMANVRYTVTSPAAILCGDFTFNATEDELSVSTPPLSGIALFDPSITSPTFDSEVVFDTNNPSSARVSIIVTRRSHLVIGALPNPAVGFTALNRIFTCETTSLMEERTYSGFPGIVSFSYNLNFIGNPLNGGSCEVEVFVDELGQGRVTSRIPVIFRPVAAQVDFSTDLDAANAVAHPATEGTYQTLTVTATATKGDNIAEDGRRGVIFRSILASSTPAGACVVMSPTALIPSIGGNSDIIYFPATTQGAQTNFNYEFGVAVGFQNTNVTCEWSVSATAEHSPDANVGATSVYLKFVPSGNLPPSFVIGQGNVTRFPDEGPVQYTLTITRQDEIGDGQLVVTPTTADACRITPPAQPPAYQNRMATATYSVEYVGATNATGDVPGGTCVVSFVVAEDRATTPVQQRSITFNTELAPNIDAQVIENRVNVPTDQMVNVSVTATKQDNSNTMAVTFPREIRSSSSCLATLAGNELRQYNGILAGSSSVTVTYMVTSTITGGVCGNFAFTATEGAATATHILSSDLSFNIADADGDGLLGADDIDEDGDGLIEIATAEDLNQVRDDLAGSSFSGNSSGCGGSFHTNGSRIQECSGYELVADIDLAAAGYDNWNPIGRNPAFTAIFEGNDHIISNSNINSSSGENWGFFGSINDAFIRNVRLQNINMMSSGDNVGGLVGSASGRSMITNSSVTASLVQGKENVGGLVGNAISDVQIISSYAEIGKVTGDDAVGGLVGSGEDVAIKLSYVMADTLSIGASLLQTTRIGGLVGAGEEGVSISSSTAMVSNIMISSTGARLGGLVGGTPESGSRIDISFSSVIISNFTTSQSILLSGGIVWIQQQGTLSYSYAVNKNILGDRFPFSGLLGLVNPSFIVSASYWDSTTLTPPDASNRAALQYGEGKSTTDLQGTTDFSDIYSAWGNGWCDATTNEFTTDPSHSLATTPNADANRFWDLGAANEYPAMNCLPNFTPAEQRAAMTRVLNDESPLRN